jgi:hypothetical protein
MRLGIQITSWLMTVEEEMAALREEEAGIILQIED